MFTEKQKTKVMLMAQGVAHCSSPDDMFLWAVRSRDTALGKSVGGSLIRRKGNTYIYLGDGVWAAEWGSSELMYLHGGLYCVKMRVRLSMNDGTEKTFNVFYNFHYA